MKTLSTSFIGYFVFISLIFFLLNFIDRKRFIEEINQAHTATTDSMVLVAETRDTDTGAHIIRTKEYVKLLALYMYENKLCNKKLTLKKIDLMYRAAPLHDVGKVAIPDSILKKPGKLTFEEFEEMKKHSTYGMQIIKNAIEKSNKKNEFLEVAYNIAYTHHEKWDGTGYPQGLKGEEIPLEGRLMAIADVYDALISKRAYKIAMPFDKVENIIIQEKDKHFDPLLVDIFISLKDDFKKIAKKYNEES